MLLKIDANHPQYNIQLQNHVVVLLLFDFVIVMIEWMNLLSITGVLLGLLQKSFLFDSIWSDHATMSSGSWWCLEIGYGVIGDDDEGRLVWSPRAMSPKKWCWFAPWVTMMNQPNWIYSLDMLSRWCVHCWVYRGDGDGYGRNLWSDHMCSYHQRMIVITSALLWNDRIWCWEPSLCVKMLVFIC